MICLCLLILLAIGALFVWHVPGALRLIAAHLIARAVQIEDHPELLRQWKGTLGVGETRACETKRRLEAARCNS